MNSEDNYPSDLGMVPTGTKCGTNMVKMFHASEEHKVMTHVARVLMPSCCVSGVLQSALPGDQEHSSVWNERLFCEMQ